MEKIEVEAILKELGYYTKNELNKGYTVYYNKNHVSEIYLGPWYIESLKSALAFPYKENNISKESLSKYITDGEYDLP